MSGVEFGGPKRIVTEGDRRLPISIDSYASLQAPSAVESQFMRLLTTGTNEERALSAGELVYGLIYDLKLPMAARVLSNELDTQPPIQPGVSNLPRVWLKVLQTHLALVAGREYSGPETNSPEKILSAIVGCEFRSEAAFRHPLLRGGEYEARANVVASALTRYHAYFWRILAAQNSDELEMVLRYASDAQWKAPASLEAGLLAATCSDLLRRLGRLSQAQTYAELAVREVDAGPFARMLPEVLIRQFGVLLASKDLDGAERTAKLIETISTDQEQELYQVEGRLFRLMVLVERNQTEPALRLLHQVEGEVLEYGFGHLNRKHLVPALRARLEKQLGK